MLKAVSLIVERRLPTESGLEGTIDTQFDTWYEIQYHCHSRVISG
jgi:hypothetical protein